MYLGDNIWGSHRRDKVRKKCLHFTEGHSSRKLFILCRRSRSAAVANGCAANQGTDILIADNILKSKSGQQGTNILQGTSLARQNKGVDVTQPEKLVQTFWMASPEPSNPPVVWTPLVGSCRPARFHALLSSPFRRYQPLMSGYEISSLPAK